MLEFKSFDVCKNATAPIITMLDYSKVNTEVSSADIETMESNNCRKVSRDDRDTNEILVAMQEGARFFYKDGWKCIDLFIQSISRLCWVS